MKWAENVARMGDMRNSCEILAGIPEEKSLVGRTRCTWEDAVRAYRKEIGWEWWSGLIWLG
jgi:hypothetical protein